MPHETALIGTIAAGLGLAFLLGLLAARLKLPPLVGYLLAGIAVGPFTPGFVADAGLASQLAEIGVMLLMFGVGLHFSLRDLLAVRKIAVPGAVVQIAVASLLGALIARVWGWSWTAGLVFGLTLSTASTVVLLRALTERGILDSINGRIAVGWLIVEDLAMVLALVLLPALALSLNTAGVAEGTAAGGQSVVWALTRTIAGVVTFVAIMLVAGRRFIPWLLGRVARMGSQELFTLAVLAIALGIAVGAAALFGVSPALGAFFAGVVIAESDLSYQAAADALPLQDAFAVLFFVSVGMLFNPTILLERPLEVLAVVAIIMVGKSIAALGIVLAFGYPMRTALTVSASLAQIGEFAFILVGLAISLNLVPPDAQSLVLAGALLSITLNPFVFNAIEPVKRWLRQRPALNGMMDRRPTDDLDTTNESEDTKLRNHAVIVGHGRVGSVIADTLAASHIPFVVLEEDRIVVEALRRRGISAVYGDASRQGILAQVSLTDAKLLVIATPAWYQTRQIVELARQINPDIDIVVRTHSASEQRHLEELGVGRVVMGERELAFGMAHYALRSFGRDRDNADAVIDSMRDSTGPVVDESRVFGVAQ